VSHDLKQKRLSDASPKVVLVELTRPQAGVRDQFVDGRASILDGLGRAVAARVTDRS